MDRPKVLLVVPDGELRARYELILRFCGLDTVAAASDKDIQELPEGIIAACVLTDHHAAVERMCARLLGAAIPVIKIDPFIRHAREHLPFDVVLPASSEPRELISAIRHLVPDTARPA
jgi:hypothetical protein